MTSERFFGIDVAKEELVIDTGTGLEKIANTAGAIAGWLTQVPSGSRIGLEATSHYHQGVADAAVRAGLVVYVLNPRDTRHYAQGLGRRGKTDAVDARIIRRLVMAEHGQLRAYEPASAPCQRIAQLQRRRAGVVKHRQALQKAFRGIEGVEEPLQAAIDRLDALMAALDQQIQAALQQQPALWEAARRYQSVPGIGRQTAAQLAALFSRVTLAHSDAAVAFVGLDPRACDSGQKLGRRRLSKRGPSELRRLLYNGAQAAARTATWKPLYQRLRARALSTTAALVILARKLLRVAFALSKQPHARFDPAKVAGLHPSA